MPIKGEYASLRCKKDFESDSERLDFLADLIEEGSEDATIYSFTRKLLNQYKIDSYDNMGEIGAIFDWVQKNITYRNHVMCRDSFQTANRTLALMSGDCDQATVLLCSMLLSVGIPAAMRVVTMDKKQPFHHIYALAGNPKRSPSGWVPLDATNKKKRVGWEPQYARKLDYRVICNPR